MKKFYKLNFGTIGKFDIKILSKKFGVTYANEFESIFKTVGSSNHFSSLFEY